MTVPSPSPAYIARWRQFARRDWRRMHVHLSDGDSAAAGAFLQQVLEKFLKGYLLSRGWHLLKLHILPRLLDDALEFDPQLESFRDLCERVTEYYMTDRYPDLEDTEPAAEGPTVDDVRRDAAAAVGLIALLFPDETLSKP